MSIKPFMGGRASLRAKAGAGLVELMVAMALAGMATGAILTLFSSGSKELARMFHYCDLNAANQVAVDTLTRDIRNANRVTAHTANTLELEAVDGSGLTYTFDRAKGTLTRSTGAESEILLTGCESLTFTLLKRNPMEDFNNFPSSSSPATCKVINIRLKCFRTLLGRKQISESVTTANVVIRRQ